MDHAELKETFEKGRTEKQNEDNEALSTKDNEEPTALTGVRQKKSDDNLKKKLPENDTDQKAVEDVTDKLAGLALDKDSQSTSEATPPSPDRVQAVSPQGAGSIVPNALVVNACSLHPKKEILQYRLDDDLYWAHVILVSETWYSKRHKEVERSINGYNGFFRDREIDKNTKSRGGGVAIYLSDADCTEAISHYEDFSPFSEAVGVTFMFEGVRWLAVCIYSVPTTGENNRKERTEWNNRFIQEVLGSERAKIDVSQNVIVGGDLNNSEVTLDGFKNYVKTITRKPPATSKQKESILDLLYTNHPQGWKSVETEEDKEKYKQISDHFIVRAIFQVKAVSEER